MRFEDVESRDEYVRSLKQPPAGVPGSGQEDPAECQHESWEGFPSGGRKCADCGTWLPEDEREGGQESPAETCPCAPGNCSGRYSDAICRVMRAEPDQCDKSWLRGVFAMAANRVSLTELANGEIPERVTRVEVIDETGRAYSRRNVYVRAMCQDDGRTLKLFIDGDKQGLEP